MQAFKDGAGGLDVVGVSGVRRRFTRVGAEHESLAEMTGRLAAELVECLGTREQDGAADALGQARQGAFRHER